MKSSLKFRLLSILLWAILAIVLPGPLQARERETADYDFSNVKHSDENNIMEYSGKTVEWEGTLKELLSKEAFFEYVVELPSGDNVRLLSGNGIKFNNGDYLKIKGFIMIKNGRFSHLVLEDARITQKKQPQPQSRWNMATGLYRLDQSEEKISKKVYDWILYYNPGISPKNADFISNRIVFHSKKYGVDPLLVTAVISAESAFNIYAVSVAGAIGLGQLMPGTAAMMGVDPYNPDQNISGCARYLRGMLDRWGKTTTPLILALASYNAGPGAIEQYGGVPPYQETMDYVRIVTSLYAQLQK